MPLLFPPAFDVVTVPISLLKVVCRAVVVVWYLTMPEPMWLLVMGFEVATPVFLFMPVVADYLCYWTCD